MFDTNVCEISECFWVCALHRKHSDSARHQTSLFLENNCYELQGDLRVWALLLHDFMAGVWSVIISNVINTFSMGAAGGSALCERVCFVRETEKRRLCVGFVRGWASFVILTGACNIGEWWCVAFVTQGLPLPQSYNYLVNILATSIDYLANPITEPAIDPSASSATISTLSKETLNSTCTIGSLTA